MPASEIQTFGKYQILERIATGGMAEIYKARLEGIGGFQRTYAIKRILPNLSQNKEYIAMLQDEARVAGLLSHANIVQILDLGEVEGIWYIAMEYVAGRDLGGVLRRAREKGLCLPVPHGVFIAIELLKGLEYAHHRQMMRGGRPVTLNIIHRDVSPPNVLLSFQGEVKLTDFGIARASLKAMETVSGLIKGRFDYMSPEQARGAKDLDQRTDLFSVGVVLYEMLTGHHPFRQANEFATVEKVRNGDYIPVSKRNPEVPISLQSIVDRALTADRDKRFPSATAFKESLDTFFQDAGFIFTHATLASYVQGLFPSDGEKKSSARSALQHSAATQNTRDTGQTQPEEDEQDTRAHDRQAIERDIREEKRSSVPAPIRREETDEPTSLRKNPLGELLGPGEEEGWGNEPISNRIKAQVWEDEQQTVIKPSPLDLDPLFAPEPADIPMDLEPESPTSDGLAYLVGFLSGTGGLFVGVLAGMLLMVLAGWGLGFQRIDGPTEIDPKIRILAPKDVQVLLDNDRVSKNIVVSPDEPHELEIRLDGYEPWKMQLTLQRNEHRVLIISATDLVPKVEDAP